MIRLKAMRPSSGVMASRSSASVARICAFAFAVTDDDVICAHYYCDVIIAAGTGNRANATESGFTRAGTLFDHLHYDARFLFQAGNENFQSSSESLDLAWVPLDRPYVHMHRAEQIIGASRGP